MFCAGAQNSWSGAAPPIPTPLAARRSAGTWHSSSTMPPRGSLPRRRGRCAAIGAGASPALIVPAAVRCTADLAASY